MIFMEKNNVAYRDNEIVHKARNQIWKIWDIVIRKFEISVIKLIHNFIILY